VLKKILKMNVREHYEYHLSHFYTWMIGDFESKKNEFKDFCLEHNIVSTENREAIDLGAGTGIQSIALAELGFNVTAVDFNDQLLAELKSKINNHSIEIINDDVRSVAKLPGENSELIVCCGDTLSHLESFDEIRKLIQDAYNKLTEGGKMIISFRDYGKELKGSDRFISVKEDDNRILTCFLEYFPNKIMVTDLLYEKVNNSWVQKVSSYNKVRLTKDIVLSFMVQSGFTITTEKLINRFVTIIADKSIGTLIPNKNASQRNGGGCL
jgi:ubiquinone/menaquinone biosynthesis C-methylase UbiE